MSSWKDTSDFASLSAALAQMKKKKSEVKEVINEIEEVVVKSNEPTGEATIVAEDDKKEGENSSIQQHSEVVVQLPEEFISVKFHCSLSGHKSVVSCLNFERSGARLISGSHDSTVAYWDFAGMTLDAPEPFHFIQPLGSNPIRSICPSNDSQWFLFCAATPSAKLFDRNGAQIREYAKGDPYLRDLRHTIGHVAALTSACWSPEDEDRFFTASEDGCIRQWHIGYRAASEAVLRVRSRTPQRCLVTAVACLPNWLLAGAADGILRLYPLRTYSKATPPPVNSVAEYQMHGRISIIAVTKDKLAARTVDGQVCVFEVHNSLFKLVNSWNDKDLASSFEEVSLCFLSQDSLFTGCRGGLAQLNLLNGTKTILPFPDEVASVAWNSSTGQLACGHASGKISIFLSESGRGGARLMAACAATKKLFGEADITAGELYASRGTSKKKADKVRADPLATHRPELPVYGQGQGGRLGSNVTQQIMRHVLKDTTRDVDPREALLAYAEKASKNPKWVATAYSQTQPEPVFDVEQLEKEAKAEEERKRRHEEMERLQQERKKREKL